MTAADAGKQWPNAKLDEKTANGPIAYFIRGTQRPIMLSLQHRDDNKTAIEIKVPPFAEPQTLEASQPVFGLPIPKPSKTSGGSGGDTEHSAHAHVAAEVGTVLEFYRRELTARNWKEETQGAIVNADDVTLNFTAPEGPAVLKLSHKYDLTIANLVLHLQKPAAAKARSRRPGRLGRCAAQAGATDDARGHHRSRGRQLNRRPRRRRHEIRRSGVARAGR